LQVYQEAMDNKNMTPGVKPVYIEIKRLSGMMFSDNTFYWMTAKIKQNFINTYDRWYNSWT